MVSLAVLGALSIAENIYLGAEPRTRLGLIDRKALVTQAQALLDDLGIILNPNDLVETLSVADKQMVEIAKALRSEAKVLILDEPTAVLTPQESRTLFKTLRQLLEEGLSIIFISHKLAEVMSASAPTTTLSEDSRAARILHGSATWPATSASTN